MGAALTHAARLPNHAFHLPTGLAFARPLAGEC